MVLTSWEIGTAGQPGLQRSDACCIDNDDDDDIDDNDNDDNDDDANHDVDDDGDNNAADDHVDDAKNDDDNDDDVLEKFVLWWRNPEAHVVNGHGDVKWWVWEQ